MMVTSKSICLKVAVYIPYYPVTIKFLVPLSEGSIELTERIRFVASKVNTVLSNAPPSYVIV